MMKKTLTICAAIAAFVCAAAPDDIATESYAHYEATNECAKTSSALTSLIDGRHNQAKAYADTKSAVALASAKEYADGRLVAAKEYSDVKIAAVREDIETGGYLTPSATNGLAKVSYVDAKTDGMATTAWVEGLGYVTTPALLGMGYASTNDVRALLTPYATKTYVVGLGYLTEDEMKAWVNGQVFAKESWVTDNMSVMGGEVRQWVFDQNYADKDWVANYHNTHGGGGSEPQLTPIYSDTPTFSEWVCQPDIVEVYWDDFRNMWQTGPSESTRYSEEAYNPNATNIVFSLEASGGEVTATRTRTDIIGYTLGSQTDKPLQPKGDYAPAANIAKTALAQDVQTSLNKADTALQTAPVASVNSKTGTVSLTASDVGALGNSGSQTLNGVLTQTGRGPQGIEKGICISNLPNNGTDWFFSAYGSYPTDITIRIPFSSAGQLVDVAPTLALLSDITAAISPTSSTFSNAVLAVGLGIDTNAVAVINELVDSASDLPVSGATSVGALLLALAAAIVSLKNRIPYTIGTPTVIDSNSVQTDTTDPNNPITYGEATLDNRTENIVQVSATLDELRITFPASTFGKLRDFGLRVEIGTGSAALAAPALVPVALTGETIKLENTDGTIPELVDGTATAKGVMLLYFSETASGVFVVKGEQVEEVA